MKNKLQAMKAQVREMRNKKGFTLIELIVVIAVLGILVLLAAPKFLGYTQDANVTTLKADAKVLENASLVYHVDEEVNGKPGAWPVGTDTYTLASVDVDGDGTADTLTGYAFDAAKLGDKVKTLKNDLSDYAITTDGTVFYVGDTAAGGSVGSGVKDSDGNEHFGTALEIPAQP